MGAFFSGYNLIQTKINVNTITEWRGRWRQVSNSANNTCAYWCWWWSWGRCLTFGSWGGHRSKLLWLVVEGRGGDFEVQRGCHHEWLVAVGVLHFLYLSEDDNREHNEGVPYRKCNFFVLNRNMKQAAVTIKELQPQNSYCYNPHDKSNVNQLTELKGLAFLGSRCTSCIFALVVMTHQWNAWPDTVANQSPIIIRFRHFNYSTLIFLIFFFLQKYA